MGDSSAKKRKREHLEVEDPDPAHRQKRQVVEATATDTGIHGHPAKKRLTKDGKSRQEKSERRLSKKQKRRTIDALQAEDAGREIPDPTPEKGHKKHRNANAKELDTDKAVENSNDEPSALSSEQSTTGTRNGEPTGMANNSSAVLASANSKNPSISHNTAEKRPTKKSRTKVASTQGLQSEVDPDGLAVEGRETSKPQRFIIFVGNLPYSATTPQIKSHFAKLAPTSIRHSTDKSTGRSKGFAFLEFAGYDKMKTCLKLYHHSIFDPAESVDDQDQDRKDKKKAGRRINVELTVGGGGGRSEKRRQKIKGKNVKLQEERERWRIKELQEAEKETEKKANNPATDANATLRTEKENDMGDIHPSRRGRMG